MSVSEVEEIEGLEDLSSASLSPEMQQLVIDVYPESRRIARQVYLQAPHALDMDELTSLGNVGLLMAAVRWHAYCLDRGFSPDAVQYFKAFATRRMRGAMLDSMRKADWATRSMRSKAKALREAGSESGASEAELSAKTNMTVAQIRETQAGMARRPVSLDADESIDVESSVDVASTVVLGSVLEHAVQALRSLPLDVQKVIALRYFEGLDLKDVAARLGFTDAYTSQLHVQGIMVAHEALLAVVSREE